MTEKNMSEVLAEEAEAAEAGRDLPYPRAHRIRPRKADGPARVFSVRIPEGRIAELQQLAAERHTTPSALLRSWVLEQLEQEQSPTSVTVVDPEALAEILRRVVREELAAG